MGRSITMRFNTGLFAPGDRVLVAVSGGADSLTLLHLLASARDQLRIEVAAGHVHHGMRGDEADADQAFLETTCAEWRVPLLVDRRDVPALANRRRVSMEEAGRDARYEAFAGMAAAHECRRIATAHTADDQAETVLLNLFRGCGLDGLAGIPVRRPLQPGEAFPEVVRPLLSAWRSDTEAYCGEQGLQPRDDRTNRDLRYRRSRIRHLLLPALAEYDTNIRRHLVRLARQAAEEAELLLPEAERLLTAASADMPMVFNARVLVGAPPALQRRTIRLALRRLAAWDIETDAGLVERLMHLAGGTGNPALDLPGGRWRARRRADTIVFERKATPTRGGVPSLLGPITPGVTEAAEFGLRLEIEVTGIPADLRLPPQQAVFDADALRGALFLRAPRTGDRFRPLGAPGSRLLSDLFTDRKVPRDRRPTWPVLTDGEGIVWVVGLAVAERVRVAETTQRCLRVWARSIRPPA